MLRQGAYSLVAVGAVATEKVPDYAVAGVPAKRIGWVSETGEGLGAGLVCPGAGKRYRELGPNGLDLIPEEFAV